MATRGHGTAAIYGRVHASVTELYAVMKNGSAANSVIPVTQGAR
jgi:hypothetical protein